MTCTQMLERLIEADPDALAGRGSSDVAAHVRECARCGAVARQLLADTSLLAATVNAKGAIVRRMRPAPIVLALAAAATVAFLMLPQQPGARPELAVQPPASVAVQPAPASQAPAISPPSSSPVAAESRERRAEHRAPSAERRAPSPASHLARAYPAAIPIRVSPMSLTSSEPEQQQVVVTPPAGKRAAVMRTGDPAITVVWVY
jgi:hypothetical protein